MTNVFPRKSNLLKEQQKWWSTPSVLFSPKYAFRVIVFAILLIGLGVFSYLLQWIHYLEIGYRVQALAKEKAKVQQRIELLEIEVAFLTRPERLDRIASTQLKLLPPKLNQHQQFQFKQSDE